MAEEWTPEFEGQRPPFPAGNELAVTHGAFSPRRVDPLAKSFVELVLADPGQGYLTVPAWRPAVWAWARAEAQIQLLTEWLADRSGDDGVGDLADEAVARAYLLLHRAESRAITLRARLGLDPLSRARLGRDKASAAVDIAQLWAQMEKETGDE